jgi:hypothetical protein
MRASAIHLWIRHRSTVYDVVPKHHSPTENNETRRDRETTEKRHRARTLPDLDTRMTEGENKMKLSSLPRESNERREAAWRRQSKTLRRERGNRRTILRRFYRLYINE